MGYDTIAAQAVLSVKETHPEVKLILVLPCENQTKYWKQQDIDVYNDIKLRADNVKVLAPQKSKKSVAEATPKKHLLQTFCDENFIVWKTQAWLFIF